MRLCGVELAVFKLVSGRRCGDTYKEIAIAHEKKGTRLGGATKKSPQA